MAKTFLTESETQAAKQELRALTKEDILNLDYVVVHDTVFHCDDVTVIAEVDEYRAENGVEPVEVIRASRNGLQDEIDKLVKAGKKFIVADMGNGNWDHHDLLVTRFPDDRNLSLTKRDEILKAQRKAEPYSASSKLWNFAIGPLWFGDKFTKDIDDEYFRIIDAMDNFGSIRTQYGNVPSPISIAVKRMNKDPKDPNVQMEQFKKAVEFVRMIFRNMIESYKAQKKSYEENNVDELESSGNTIVVLDNYIASTVFSVDKTHYIVEPNNNPGWWQVTTTSSELYPIIERADLSGHVRAKLDRYDTDVDSGVIKTQKPFFHKTGFLCVVPSKELAIAIANESEMIVAVEK